MASELMKAIEASDQMQGVAEQELDPNFQQEMYLIESALRDAGVMQKAGAPVENTIYDDYFMQLINAIPME